MADMGLEIDARLKDDNLIFDLKNIRKELNNTKKEASGLGDQLGTAFGIGGRALGAAVGVAGGAVGLAKIAGPRTNQAFAKFNVALQRFSLVIDRVIGPFLNQVADKAIQASFTGRGVGVSPGEDDLLPMVASGVSSNTISRPKRSSVNTDYIGRKLSDFENPLEGGGDLSSWVNWVKRMRGESNGGGQTMKVEKIEVKDDGLGGNGPWGTFS